MATLTFRVITVCIIQQDNLTKNDHLHCFNGSDSACFASAMNQHRVNNDALAFEC